MFSQTLEYAMRIVAHLSTQDEPLTTRQIAVATEVPVSYLSKVLQALNRNGLVTSQRGLHGGSVLARPADQITLYDIAQAIDPIRRITTCPLGLKSHGTRLCPLHKQLDQTMELVEQSFRDVTIAGLLSEPSASKPLCDVGPVHASRASAKGRRPVQLGVTKRR